MFVAGWRHALRSEWPFITIIIIIINSSLPDAGYGLGLDLAVDYPGEKVTGELRTHVSSLTLHSPLVPNLPLPHSL